MSNFEYALPPKSGEAALLKSRLTGLLMACPIGQDNPPDCPLHALRQQPLCERYRWLGNLPRSQMNGLVEQHTECYARKVQAEHEPA
jgi:hypothetical protein